jgi:ketosteroid isomerase-like protein
MPALPNQGEIPMSTDNISVVRGMYEAFQRGDINAVLNSYAPNITWYSPGGREIPWAGARQGREQVGQFFAQLDASLEFLDFATEQFAASGDTVIVIGRDRVRVKASGDVLDEQWAHVMQVRDGQVVDFREIIDTAALVASLQKAATRV